MKKGDFVWVGDLEVPFCIESDMEAMGMVYVAHWVNKDAVTLIPEDMPWAERIKGKPQL